MAKHLWRNVTEIFWNCTPLHEKFLNTELFLVRLFLYSDTFHAAHKWLKAVPAGIYLLKFNNWNTRIRCEICSNLKTKIPERHLCCSLFFNKLAGYNFLKKEILAPVFSCEFCVIIKNNFLKKHLLMNASKNVLIFGKESVSEKYTDHKTRWNLSLFLYNECRDCVCQWSRLGGSGKKKNKKNPLPFLALLWMVSARRRKQAKRRKILFSFFQLLIKLKCLGKSCELAATTNLIYHKLVRTTLDSPVTDHLSHVFTIQVSHDVLPTLNTTTKNGNEVDNCRFWRQWYPWHKLQICNIFLTKIADFKQHLSEHLWSTKAFSLIFLTHKIQKNHKNQNRFWRKFSKCFFATFFYMHHDLNFSSEGDM